MSGRSSPRERNGSYAECSIGRGLALFRNSSNKPLLGGDLGRAITAAPDRRADFFFGNAERIVSHNRAAAHKLHVSHAIQIFHRIANRILREKLNYQFTRLLSFRAIVDYSTVDRDSTLSRVEPEHRWGVDLLFTYLVHPGTALYVGYSDRYENFRLLPGNPPALERSSSPGMSMGRQVFVKLNYLWLF